MATKSGTNKSEPNAQNSEINPNAHPSGARIENMMNDAEEQKAAERAGVERPTVEKGTETVTGPEKGAEKGSFGETLRPSERYTPPEDEPAEGSRDEVTDRSHRMSPEDR